ncbi:MULTISPECIES: class I SAM-dependent methyltransferase [Rhodoplanes]|uniref:class I SAM-dependent methyltransferase n=1 Tax=Rhodoplanes TaxID=29407 RepID=UPI0013E9ED42|nr:class I SAM-dependent methyltransferase [Rhodoplanes serenus]
MLTDHQTPVPPDELIVTSVGAPDAKTFLATGEADKHQIVKALTSAGLDMGGGDLRVLDWGCGCGRIARHWKSHSPSVDFHGCDINRQVVGWCRDNLGFGSFMDCGVKPPLPFPDSHFDVVYGISVLTHLTFETQYLWMCELWRILKPGGRAVLTICGPSLLPMWLPNIGGENAKRTQTVLIDEQIFLCTSSEDGPNSTGTMETAHVFETIFSPFRILQYQPRSGLMGIQDTYVVSKIGEGHLTFIPRLLDFAVTGSTSKANVAINLRNERNITFLVGAPDLYRTAKACFRLVIPEGRGSVESDIVTIPQKVGWTGLHSAYARVAIAGIPEWTGLARLEVEVEVSESADRARFELHNAAIF